MAIASSKKTAVAQKKAIVRKSVSKKYSAHIPSSSTLKVRTRNFKSTYVPVPLAEKLRRRRERSVRAASIRTSIAEIRQHIRDECHKLATTWKMKPQYFLDMVYQGGVRLTKPANNLNPFNAFKAVKAYERREAGETPMSLLEIQTKYRPEYDALDKKGLDDMLKKYATIKDEERREKIKRPSLKEKMADVAGSLSNVSAILQALKTRVGIEAMLLVVRNRPEDYMSPRWILTDDRLMEYLHVLLRYWNPVYIGQKLEAFAVSKFNMALACKTTKEYAELLKKMITRSIQDGLDEACSTNNLTMQYERFDKLITQQYGVVIEGWPTNLPFQQPGGFHNDTEQLSQLEQAWKSGTAHFRKLPVEEHLEWKAQRAQGIQDGSITLKTRKKRCDAGTKRPRKGKEKANGKAKGQGNVAQDGESESEGDSDESEGDTDTSDQGDSGKDNEDNVGALTKTGAPKKGPAPKKATASKGSKSKSSSQGPRAGRSKDKCESQTQKATSLKKKGADASTQKIPTNDSTAHPKRANPRTTQLTISTAKSIETETTESDGSNSVHDTTPSTPPPPLPPRPLPRRRVPLNSTSVQNEAGGVSVSQVTGPDTSKGAQISGPGVATPITPVPMTPFTPVLSDSTTIAPTANTAGPSCDNPSNPSVACPDPVIDPSLLDVNNSDPVDQISASLPPDQPTGTSDDQPATSPPELVDKGNKRGRQVDFADTLNRPEGPEETGRGKRVRFARKRTHLGASSHPSTKDYGSDDDNPPDGSLY
ncbi:hypothetical protein PM082_014236 [Marasmius tenuissimus]|nr:hypothetical protein PM082_014236 [Marasmius tenuissimus]